MIKLLPLLIESSEYYTIYCDLDGVLSDFVKAYKDLTGKNIAGNWQTGDEFWKPIHDAGAKYWANMNWMPDGKNLWKYIKKYRPTILSAPSDKDASIIGKNQWMKRELPGVKSIITPAVNKKNYATSTSILIDDMPKNIDEWRNAGGIGILHKNVSDTINQLRKLGI